MAATRIDKIKMQIRTKLKGAELEAELANHMATLKARDRIVETKKSANKDFAEELKEKDDVIAEQRLTLDKGELGTVEVEVATGPKGKKSYKRLDTGESLDDDDLPEQMEIPGAEEALGEARAGGGGDD